MRILRGLPAHSDGPVALTIGNFDGVHRGHQAMLTRLIEAADDLRLPSAVLTFDPHPREFFAKDAAPPRLSKLRQKLVLYQFSEVLHGPPLGAGYSENSHSRHPASTSGK